jgi:uncharacterized membrane protein
MSFYLATLLLLFLTANVPTHATTYSFTTIDVPGATNTVPTDVNEASQVVGWFTPGFQGFMDSGGSISTINVPNASQTQVFGINNAGQIAGSFSDMAGMTHGFLRTGSTFSTVDVPGAQATSVFGIANTGEVVGGFRDATGTHGFTRVGTTFTALNVPGASLTVVTGVNDGGQVVGLFTDVAGTHGFLSTAGTATPINVPGAVSTGFQALGIVFGLGINNAGDVAGVFEDTNGQGHGFVKTGSLFTTLDVPGASQTTAWGINEAGQVVGTFGRLMLGPGSTGVGAQGFLASPSVVNEVPEPSSLWLLSVGPALWLLHYVSRRTV